MKSKKYKLALKTMLLLMGILSTSNVSYAEKLTEYEELSLDLKMGQARALTSKVKMKAELLASSNTINGFPPAYILEENWQGSSSASKIPKGTFLYRHYYGGVYFYSPVPPEQFITETPVTIKRADGSSVTIPANTQWLNPRWGPNQDSSTALSGSATRVNSVVTSATISKATASTDIRGNTLTIPAGTYTNNPKNGTHIVGYTSEGLYLRANGAYSGVVKITKNYTINAKDAFFQSGYGNNLKKYRQAIDTPGFGYFEVSPNTSHELWNKTNPSKQTWGEWRHLGFSSMGDIIPNPYFPADGYDHYTLSTYGHYPWASNPWNTSIFQRYVGTKTAYDDASNSMYYQLKVDAIKELMASRNKYGEPMLSETVNNPGGNSYTYWINKFSLRCDPVHEGKSLAGARSDGTRYRIIMDRASVYRDLYISKMEVYGKGASSPDEENRLLGTFTRSSASDKNGKSTIADKLIPGETYTIKTYITNDSELETIADKIYSQTVPVNNNKSNPEMFLMFAEKSPALHVATMSIEKALPPKTESKEIIYKFTVKEDTTNGNVDVFSWVGREHWGIDNTDSSNDKGYIKFEVNGVEPDDDCDPLYEVCDVPQPPQSSCIIGRNSDSSTTTLSNDSNDVTTKVGAKASCPPTGNEKGDLSWDYIQLIDENGTVVYSTQGGQRQAIKPGTKYRIKAKGSYKGDTLVEPVYGIACDEDSCWSYVKYCNTLSTSLTMDYVYYRKLGTKDESEKVSKSAGSASIMLVPGASFEFTSNYILFDRPWGRFEVKLNHEVGKANSSGMNDCETVLVDDDYDIKIENARVVPHTEYILSDKKEMVYQVVYDAVLSVPSYVKESDYETQINTQITLGTHKEVVKDQLKIGRNDGLTHTIKVPVNGSGVLNGNVNLNYDKESFEYKKSLRAGDYSNNAMQIKTEVKSVASPVTKFNKPSGTTEATKGGSANNNCMIPVTSNKWTNQNRVHTWTSTTIKYTGDGPLSNKTYSFRKYSSKTSTSTKTYTESYTIDNIMFKSKVTKDKKLGANGDGWVDLLKSSESKLGLIKAGYGFELKIVVTYKTDASNPAKEEFITNGESGTTVTEQNSGINLIDDIYLELPGDNSTRKVLSASGYSGTRKGLVYKTEEGVEGNNKYIRYTFSIKEANTSGVKESGKIFIPVNLKDGVYTLNIYTPPQTGVFSTNKQYSINRTTKALTKHYTDLCDRKQVTITVQGSATDDLNSHDTQK